MSTQDMLPLNHQKCLYSACSGFQNIVCFAGLWNSSLIHTVNLYFPFSFAPIFSFCRIKMCHCNLQKSPKSWGNGHPCWSVGECGSSELFLYWPLKRSNSSIPWPPADLAGEFSLLRDDSRSNSLSMVEAPFVPLVVTAAGAPKASRAAPPPKAPSLAGWGTGLLLDQGSCWDPVSQWNK